MNLLRVCRLFRRVLCLPLFVLGYTKSFLAFIEESRAGAEGYSFSHEQLAPYLHLLFGGIWKARAEP